MNSEQLLVKSVGCALYQGYLAKSGGTWCDESAETWNEAALIAIAALREPTNAMVTAGWAATYDLTDTVPNEAWIRAIYTAMIDAILKGNA